MSCPAPGTSGSRSANPSFQTLRALLSVLVALVVVPSVEAGVFCCAAGNLQCLIDAINVPSTTGCNWPL